MNSNFQLNQIGTSANTSGATRADFDTSELIFYTSDQTNNRFKIESNINNYYGLYNDENEASDVFQGVNYSVTDATKTGFTIDIVTATGVGTLPLVNAPDANETIYVSYNLTINSGSPSINVVTQNRSGATITTSPDFIITEAGFYAHAITPTQDGATNLSFADDADNVNFTISDLKISRIARNGFVETWYDQSGNGNDAIQATAANQPAIVTNGGLESGLSFDGTNDFLQTSTQVLTGTETGSNGIYAVVNVTSGDAGYVAGSASDNSGGGDSVGQSIYASSASSKFILTNGLDADASNRDTIAITVGSFVLVSACYNDNDADTLQKNSSTTGYTNGSLAYDFNAGTKFTIGHRERSSGVNPATNLTGTIKEVIAFDIDTTSDRSEIQADIQNHYNI
jgi:hypothetical protein